MPYYIEECYMPARGARLYTMIMRPAKEGRYPTVLSRSPYGLKGDHGPILEKFKETLGGFPRRGYCVIYQHCRGTGESEGNAFPNEYGREDGLALQEWVRHQSFYNGEIFLTGGSYTALMHYVTAPFAEDIKGAVLDVMTPVGYDNSYRNGVFKKGLIGGWYFTMYKKQSKGEGTYTGEPFEYLPLLEMPKAVKGERMPSFEALLSAADPENEYWKPKLPGLSGVKVPVLLLTGHADIEGGSLVNYYLSMDPKDRAHCALVISASDHSDRPSPADFPFPCPRKTDRLGEDFRQDFFDACRGLRPFSAPLGKVTGYCYFDGDPWKTDDFSDGAERELSLGSDTVGYIYDPADAPAFPGGITNSFTGVKLQPPPNFHPGVITRYTEPFEEDTYLRGTFQLKLTLSSDCEDTGLYFRVSIETPEGDLALRDDVNSLANLCPNYIPGQKVTVTLTTDRHFVLAKKGTRLRVDMASADRDSFVRHTNVKGPYAEVRKAKIAHNILYLGESGFYIPVLGKKEEINGRDPE